MPLKVTKEAQLTRITLNRPRALNAINLEMVGLLKTALTMAQTDGTKIIIIEGAGDRGLSGGGDIKEMASENAKNGSAFIKAEYELDLMIAESKVPVIGIMHGITMGGGIGVSAHSSLRIVTETSRLAMPEVKIGIIPDVGGNLLLAKSPGRLGEYLALTCTEMNAADAIAMGFADLKIDSANIPDFISALAAKQNPDQEYFMVAGQFAIEPGQSELLQKREWVDPLLEKVFTEAGAVTLETVTEAGAKELAEWSIRAVVRLLEACDKSKLTEHQDLAQTMRQMSPTSLAVALGAIARTRALNLNLAEVLADDLRVLTRLFQLPDFVEGVRALAIDKDQSPKWIPSSAEALKVETVARVLDPQL